MGAVLKCTRCPLWVSDFLLELLLVHHLCFPMLGQHNVTWVCGWLWLVLGLVYTPAPAAGTAALQQAMRMQLSGPVFDAMWSSFPTSDQQKQQMISSVFTQ